jgi:hypothetical protein
VFLAGSIDNGRAVDWQADITGRFAGHDITVLNPRRDNWNADLDNDISDSVFRAQVEWELDALDAATYIVFYFAPGSQAPVTMAELGLTARSGKVVVCCPRGFYRRGNVQIICRRFDIPLVSSIEALAETIITTVAK